MRSQKALREVFRELEDDFDIVLVNAPPFLPSAEAGYLTAAAGTAVVVVPDRGSITDYEELVRRLQVAAATPIGYVYCCAGCNVPSPHPGPANRLRSALHAAPRYGAPVLPQVAGLEGSRLTTEGR